jgi:ankyrin repeat protein
MRRCNAFVLAILLALMFLLTTGPFASADVIEGYDEFIEICRTGTPQEVQAAIDAGARDYVDMPVHELWTPLMNAASENGNPKVIDVLVKAGANVNAENQWDETVLALAAAKNNPAVVSALINAGASVKGDGSALLQAVRFNEYAGVVPVLIKAGADVNARDNKDKTALIYAAQRKENAGTIVAALVKAGADVNAKDADGWTAMTYAVRNNKPEVVTILEQAGATETQAMVEKAIKTREINDQFLKLCKTGTPQEIQAALKAGADVNAKNEDGDTALMFAARYNNDPEVISVLVKQGADVNAQFAECTALMYAAMYSKNPEVVDRLVKSGADVNVMGYEGSTVLDFAQSNENKEVVSEIVAILEKAGAK